MNKNWINEALEKLKRTTEACEEEVIEVHEILQIALTKGKSFNILENKETECYLIRNHNTGERDWKPVRCFNTKKQAKKAYKELTKIEID